MASVGKQLKEVVLNGCAEEVEALLRNNPDLNVNWKDEGLGFSALNSACLRGHVEVVKLLLAHPHINVNVQNRNEATPFSYGCETGQVSVVRLLLKDPRVDVTLAEEDGLTSL